MNTTKNECYRYILFKINRKTNNKDLYLEKIKKSSEQLKTLSQGPK